MFYKKIETYEVKTGSDYYSDCCFVALSNDATTAIDGRKNIIWTPEIGTSATYNQNMTGDSRCIPVRNFSNISVLQVHMIFQYTR